MAQNLIFIPVFAQVVLTLCVLFALWWVRVSYSKRHRIHPQKLALNCDPIASPLAHKLANNYSNLFELPVLFFAASAFAYCARMVDDLMLGLAVAFVISRVAHSVIHIGPNRVLVRFGAALASAVIVAAMWVLLMWRVGASGF